MSNEVLWFGFLLFGLFTFTIGIYFFGIRALYAFIPAEIIICNIQGLKMVDIFGVNLPFGNISYAMVFLATDLASEIYGPKEARKTVWVGFMTLLFYTAAIHFTLIATPSAHDTTHAHMLEMFQLAPRIAIASVISYLVSQHHDVWAYHFWKRKTKGKYLWIRNNMSTIASQFIDSIFFTLIAFYGRFPNQVLVEICISLIVIKSFVAILDTPFIYLGRWIFKTYHSKEIAHINREH